jgi:hypothetical protein
MPRSITIETRNISILHWYLLPNSKLGTELESDGGTRVKTPSSKGMDDLLLLLKACMTLLPIVRRE